MNQAPQVKPALLTALVLAACAHTDMKNNEPAAAAQTPWSSIRIADGSANGYRFTRDAAGRVQFVYDPVTPAESSTGQYSGGPPRREELDPNDARLVELWALLRKLEADEAKHTPDRAKGTGAIGWDGPQGPQDFIIPMGEELNALLAVLQRFGR